MRGREFAELQAFAAVAELVSFRRAAARLQIAPSTLSQTVRGLEERLGVRLLNRTTRSLSLTGAGERLLARFRPALDEMRAAVEDARDGGTGPRGTVRLHAPRPAYLAFVEPALRRLRKACPDILLDITVDDALANIVAAGFDLTIRLAEYADPAMVQAELGGPLCHAVVASPAYLHARGEPGHPQDLAGHRGIGWRQPGTEAPFHWRFEVAGQWTGIEVPAALVVSHCEMAVAAALDGLGLAFVLQPLAQAAVAAGRLVQVLQPYLPPFPGWRLCHLARPRASAATLEVVEQLTAQVMHS